jgi:hypothetical protein
VRGEVSLELRLPMEVGVAGLMVLGLLRLGALMSRHADLTFELGAPFSLSSSKTSNLNSSISD